jgi:Transposase DDE domain group 1
MGLDAVGLSGGGAAVGERQERPFQLSFNGSLRVDFQGARVTSDGGLLLVRELDERLGFGELIEQHLTDGHRFTAVGSPGHDRLPHEVGQRPTGGRSRAPTTAK